MQEKKNNKLGNGNIVARVTEITNSFYILGYIHNISSPGIMKMLPIVT